MKQNILRFKFDLKETKDFFCVSEKNYFSYQVVTSWPNWKNKNVFVYGPSLSGKTLISEIWQTKSNAVKINEGFLHNLDTKKNQSLLLKNKCWIIEDLDKIVNRNPKIVKKILYFINITNENKNYLLITSKKTPKGLGIIIEDLNSRLSAFLVSELKQPDERLLKEIIKKNLENKQISVDESVLDYLLNHIERTYSSAWKISKKIDKQSLQEKRKITIHLVKQILYNN